MRYDIFKGRNSRALRLVATVMALTFIIIMNDCSGGGGGSTSTTALTGSSGQLCLSDDYNYRVDLEGQSSTQYMVEPDPLASAYEGNIGGQIRGLATMTLGTPGEDLQNLLFWGMGASVKYGTHEVEVGTIGLGKPGAVTDLAPIKYGDKQMFVYGTERGVGVIMPTSEGALVDASPQGAWRSVPTGVLSLVASSDGSRILFVSKDGFLQQMSVSDIIGGEDCSGIMATKIYSDAASGEMMPERVQLGDSHAFTLNKLVSAVTTTAPTFGQAYDPIFNAMVNDTLLSNVSAIKFDTGAATDLGFTAEDGSFDNFDRFIPTDISSDGQNLYVVGVAYKQSSVGEFLSTRCTSEEDAEDPVKCMKNAAKDGTLAVYPGGGEIEEFVGGFFIYRDMGELSRADHFSRITLSIYKKDEEAPPFIYAISGDGDNVFVRGANFMVSMNRGGTTAESWGFGAIADTDNVGLTTGLPNRVMPYEDGAVSSFTAVRQPDGSGASALEYMNPGGDVFSLIDSGAIFVRVDGAGESTGLVAAIEMASSRGGNLYLENINIRKPIELTTTGAFASHAAYDGSRLAFAWSTTVSESTQPWHIAIQSGSFTDTRGQTSISRSGASSGEFGGFTEMGSCSSEPYQCRGIGGMEFSEDGRLAVLLTGYNSGKWKHQMLLYQLSKSSGVYNAPKLVGVSNTVTSDGSASAHSGNVMRVKKDGTKYEVIFSNATSIYSWRVTPNTSSPDDGDLDQMFGVTKFVDAAMDSRGGSKIAIVSGNKIIIKDAANPTAAGVAVSVQMLQGTSLTRLIGARVALSGSILALAAPYGAANTFSLFQVGDGSASLVAATKLSRFFDVKAFRFYPTYLLASSQASGIEIYDLSD